MYCQAREEDAASVNTGTLNGVRVHSLIGHSKRHTSMRQQSGSPAACADDVSPPASVNHVLRGTTVTRGFSASAPSREVCT